MWRAGVGLLIAGDVGADEDCCGCDGDEAEPAACESFVDFVAVVFHVLVLRAGVGSLIGVLAFLSGFLRVFGLPQVGMEGSR